jgi:hypothetical protein
VTVATLPANARTARAVVVDGEPVVVEIGNRGRGDVSIGGDAAGAVVVLVDAVVVDVLVVDEMVVAVDVCDVSRAELADEQALANVTMPMSATHRPRPRRTPS